MASSLMSRASLPCQELNSSHVVDALLTDTAYTPKDSDSFTLWRLCHETVTQAAACTVGLRGVASWLPSGYCNLGKSGASRSCHVPALKNGVGILLDCSLHLQVCATDPMCLLPAMHLSLSPSETLDQRCPSSLHSLSVQ